MAGRGALARLGAKQSGAYLVCSVAMVSWPQSGRVNSVLFTGDLLPPVPDPADAGADPALQPGTGAGLGRHRLQVLDSCCVLLCSLSAVSPRSAGWAPPPSTASTATGSG